MRSNLFKRIEKLAVGIKVEARFFSLDNWTRSTWCASQPSFPQSVDGVSSYFITIATRITVYNSVEIHQMSDSTGILHEQEHRHRASILQYYIFNWLKPRTTQSNILISNP